MVLGEPQIISQVKAAWAAGAESQAATGRFLDAVLQKALTVSKRVRNETAIGNSAVSVRMAAWNWPASIRHTPRQASARAGCRKNERTIGPLPDESGSKSVCVINRTYEHALDLAAVLGGSAAAFEERWQRMADSGHRDQLDFLPPHHFEPRTKPNLYARSRAERPLVVVDIAMPRDIDGAVARGRRNFLI